MNAEGDEERTRIEAGPDIDKVATKPPPWTKEQEGAYSYLIRLTPEQAADVITQLCDDRLKVRDIVEAWIREVCPAPEHPDAG